MSNEVGDDRDEPSILHCFADYGVESEILSWYGDVVRVGIDARDTNESEPIIAHFHSGKTKTLLTDEPDVFRSLLPELKRRGIWDLLDHVGLVYSGWTLEEEAYMDDIDSKDELAQYHEEVVQEYGSLGNHPARRGVHILQAYSHGVFLIRKYDHETLQVLMEAITDDPDSFGGTMML